MRKRKLLFFAVLLLSALTYGCLKEEDDTIILFGEEGYIESFDTIFGMSADSVFAIPIRVIDTIIGQDTIYHDSIAPLSHIDGINTPDVRGEYKFDPIEVVVPVGQFEAPQYPILFRFGGDYEFYTDYFHGQNHMVVHCDIRIPGLELNSELFHAEYAYVKGNGSSFFAYLKRDQEVQTPIGDVQVRFRLNQGIAIAGERLVDSIGVPGDIRNCSIALYNKDVKVLNPEEVPASFVEAIEGRKGLLTIYRDMDTITEMNRSGQPYNWED